MSSTAALAPAQHLPHAVPKLSDPHRERFVLRFILALTPKGFVPRLCIAFGQGDASLSRLLENAAHRKAESL